MPSVKLSIIIVSWNVNALLERCVQSIQEKVPQESAHEIIVIDNASYDGTSDMVRASLRGVKLIANKENRGFAAACNQGIRESRGEYVVFLNPDTELQKKTFEPLIDFLDTHQDVGIVGPRIMGGDGKVQHSVRGFPTPFVSLLIFLKLDRVLKFLPPVRKYYCLDFEYARTQEVDQPMGACLMIRKKVLDTIGMFDERFFLWFEEVDLCRRVREGGWKIFFVTDSSLTHRKAQSFSQQSIITRQMNFYTSASAYLLKHFGHSLPGVLIANMFRGYGALLQFCYRISESVPTVPKDSLFRPGVFAIALMLIGATQLLSLLVYSDMLPATPVFFIVTALVLFASLSKLPLGISILFSELIIGSKGYLFSLDSWDSRVSIRMGIFVAVMFAWIVHLAIYRKNRFNILKSPFVWWYGALGIVVFYGVVNAFIQGTSLTFIIQDANAWVFFLIAPVVYDAILAKRGIAQLLSCCLAALVAQTIGVLLAFYIMGHRGFGEIILGGWYYWIRQSGVGEITALTGSTTRVFFQSQIYALIGFFILLGYALSYLHIALDKDREIPRQILRQAFFRYRYFLLLLVCLGASLLISFSRSFWVAALFSGILFLIIAAIYRVHKKTLLIFILSMCGAGIVSVGLLIGISSIPFPSTSGVFDVQSLEERVKDLTEEEAAKSRWKLLPVLMETIQKNPLSGYGFGKTVSYQSSDPRVALTHPSGLYTTYAFEWGYLDMWIKLGFVGLLVYLGFFFTLLFTGIPMAFSYLKKGFYREGGLLLGLSCGLIALFVTHIFTPYLNHPLGIATVVFIALIFDRFSTRTSA
ncbi:glycosyltransferase [Candidatus Uhrbacteria bacterium]|nr:glycosyltransferase [Candidatus Uhrbacteria bacterium]